MPEDIKLTLWMPQTHNGGLRFSDQAWDTFNIILKSSLGGVTKRDNCSIPHHPDEVGREYKEDVYEYQLVIPANSLKRINRLIKPAKDIFGRHCIQRIATDVDAKGISLCYDKRIDRDSFTIEMKNRGYGITGLTLPFNSDSFATLDDLYNKPVSPSLISGSESPFKGVKFNNGDPSEQIEWLNTHCASIIIYGDEPMLEHHAENDVPDLADCCA
jgi:hypothetical protein